MCVSRALLSAAKGHLTATILPNDSRGDDAHRSHGAGYSLGGRAEAWAAAEPTGGRDSQPKNRPNPTN